MIVPEMKRRLAEVLWPGWCCPNTFQHIIAKTTRDTNFKRKTFFQETGFGTPLYTFYYSLQNCSKNSLKTETSTYSLFLLKWPSAPFPISNYLGLQGQNLISQLLLLFLQKFMDLIGLDALWHELEVGIVLFPQLLHQANVLLLHVLEGLARHVHFGEQCLLFLKEVGKWGCDFNPSLHNHTLSYSYHLLFKDN